MAGRRPGRPRPGIPNAKDPEVPFFRKKPPEGDEGGNGKEEPKFEPQPDKAQKWFDTARTAADSFNYDYALTCYAAGIKLDPTTMSAHEAMLEVAVKYMNKDGKPATSKEIRSITGSGTAIERFAAAEFAWMKDIRNSKLGLKAIEAAAKADQIEWGNWVAPRVLRLIRSQKKKPSKGLLVNAMNLFSQVECWDEAIIVGNMAKELDPADNQLANELNDLSVQRAMEEGGYEKAAGEEGGFREMVKDIDKQRELEESDAITGTETTEQRKLDRAREAYEATPGNPDVLNQYAQLLKKQATPESEEMAYDIYIKGYEETGQYRFRMLAGDIRIEQLERKVRALDNKLEETPDAEDLKAERAELHDQLLKLQNTEYSERVEKYPTDRMRKFDLGNVQFELGQYDEAMGQFQGSKDEPKLRVRAGHMLGRCFAAEGWHREAIDEFEEALEAIDATEKERELAIRYDLMVSLIEHAREESSVDLAKRALDICSGIARKNITYRDIRERRKEIDTLTRELG